MRFTATSSRSWHKVILCLMFTLIASGAFAAPDTIAIQGKLTSPGGSPLSGTRAWRVRFYDDPSGGAQLGSTLTGSVSLGATGRFTLEVLPPAQALMANAAWYELAIDSAPTPDGTVGPSDVFPGRVKIHGVMFAQGAFPYVGVAHVVVKATTDSLANGNNLLAAYAQAKKMNPANGQNRIVVLVSPGHYDLGSKPLVMDTAYIDLVGLSNCREDQWIEGTPDKLSTGVIVQKTPYAHLENLSLSCTYIANQLLFNPTNPAAYFPDSNTTWTVVRNCRFESYGAAYDMRVGIAYPGTYTDCQFTGYAFGSCIGGVASGTFTHCSGYGNAFGSNGGKASGKFVNCEAGDSSFGQYAMGTFIDCKGGSYSFGTDEGWATGTFTRCTAGSYSFGGQGAVTGVFQDCIGGNNSFGSNANPAKSAQARLVRCRMTGDSWSGTFGGIMQDCQWQSGIMLGGSARVYGSTFVGGVGLQGNSVGVAHCRAFWFGNEPNNIFGQGYNVSSTDVK